MKKMKKMKKTEKRTKSVIKYVMKRKNMRKNIFEFKVREMWCYS